jgi:hypothetical protein
MSTAQPFHKNTHRAVVTPGRQGHIAPGCGEGVALAWASGFWSRVETRP